MLKPEAYAATTAVAIAVASSRIVVPGTCVACGKVCRVHLHHICYALPLDVIALCPRCHKAADAKPPRLDVSALPLVKVKPEHQEKTVPIERALQVPDDGCAPSQPIESAELAEVVQKLLSKLTFREREVIKLRYGVGDGQTYTLEEVGRIFHVTRERIRQLEARAIRKLQHPKPLEVLRTAMALESAREGSGA